MLVIIIMTVPFFLLSISCCDFFHSRNIFCYSLLHAIDV